MSYYLLLYFRLRNGTVVAVVEWKKCERNFLSGGVRCCVFFLKLLYNIIFFFLIFFFFKKSCCGSAIHPSFSCRFFLVFSLVCFTDCCQER